MYLRKKSPEALGAYSRARQPNDGAMDIQFQ